jgi:uncharacterized protein (DUF2384 family)
MTIDPEVLEAGLEAFDGDRDAVVRWLDQPAHALGGRVPRDVMETPEGRRLVTSILRAIDRGTYL